MASSTDDWDDETDYDPRDVYDRTIGRLDHNTGGYQPPLASRHTIRRGVIYSGTGFPIDAAAFALQKARQDEEIFRWHHPHEERYYLGIDDPEALRQKVTSYAQRRAEPRKDLIGVANQRIEYHYE